MTPNSLKPCEDSVLRIGNLSVWYTEDGLEYPIVDNVNFSISQAETVGIVGETGCGKTITAKAILGILPYGFIVKSGSIILGGTDLLRIGKQEMKNIQGKRITFVPQDPTNALNPLHTIGHQFTMILKSKTPVDNRTARSTAMAWIKRVNLADADRIYNSYPCQLSGGQNQRILIAIALAMKPDLLIADEPTTALDSITRSELIQFLKELQEDLSLTILIISHDIGVVKSLCQRFVVMYTGQIVEYGQTEEILKDPAHPYTKGLLKALPQFATSKLNPITGDVPEFRALPPGCPFRPRCPDMMDICANNKPPAFDVSETRQAHCFLFQKAR